jgi:hypothetical protein
MALNSQARKEGWLMIDNRTNEGVPDAFVRAAMGADMPAFAGRGLFEAATYNCRHCQGLVVLNPLRTRERAYCPKCDSRLCDGCGAARAASGGECRDFERVIAEVQEQAARGRSSLSSLVLTHP